MNYWTELRLVVTSQLYIIIKIGNFKEDVTLVTPCNCCGQVRAPRGSDDLVSARDPGEYRARGALIENMMFLLQLSRINIKLRRRRDNPLIKPRRLRK